MQEAIFFGHFTADEQRKRKYSVRKLEEEDESRFLHPCRRTFKMRSFVVIAVLALFATFSVAWPLKANLKQRMTGYLPPSDDQNRAVPIEALTGFNEDENSAGNFQAKRFWNHRCEWKIVRGKIRHTCG